MTPSNSRLSDTTRKIEANQLYDAVTHDATTRTVEANRLAQDVWTWRSANIEANPNYEVACNSISTSANIKANPNYEVACNSIST
uniref:Uncharacterized protein n=1 Tax=Aegilops tauschii subsp. strangulata TaxID=200361 RepID=A0A453C048_AEGTS